MRKARAGTLRIRSENENAATGCASRFSARRPSRAKNIQSLSLNRRNENIRAEQQPGSRSARGCRPPAPSSGSIDQSARPVALNKGPQVVIKNDLNPVVACPRLR
jgi:hypothetical protein